MYACLGQTAEIYCGAMLTARQGFGACRAVVLGLGSPRQRKFHQLRCFRFAAQRLLSVQSGKPGQFLCGFSMETQNMLENSRKKLHKKNLDMIVANNLKVAGAGFGVSTNVVTLITKDGLQELPRMGKDEVAAHLLDEIQRRR